jgi:hypothetical protein
MEAARTSETSVDIQLRTRQYIPEDSVLHTRRRENLKSHIVNLYGEATLRCIRRFESLRIKKAKRLCSLSFLLRCRDQGTMPRFQQFHHHIQSEAGERIYRRTRFSLLRERIHDTRRALDEISRAMLRLNVRLAGKLSADDWALLDHITFKRAA